MLPETGPRTGSTDTSEFLVSTSIIIIREVCNIDKQDARVVDHIGQDGRGRGVPVRGAMALAAAATLAGDIGINMAEAVGRSPLNADRIQGVFLRSMELLRDMQGDGENAAGPGAEAPMPGPGGPPPAQGPAGPPGGNGLMPGRA